MTAYDVMSILVFGGLHAAIAFACVAIERVQQAECRAASCARCVTARRVA